MIDYSSFQKYSKGLHIKNQFQTDVPNSNKNKFCSSTLDSKVKPSVTTFKNKIESGNTESDSDTDSDVNNYIDEYLADDWDSK